MIELPPSKSIGARFLVATFFSGRLPADPYFQDNDDLINLQQALLEVYSDEEPIDYGNSPIDVGASGTALRFVTAVCASTRGADYVITGTPRLMERPMAPLLELLREAGARIECLGENNNGPYRVTGDKLNGGNFSIRGDISSQFISALMLVAPYWEKGMHLSFVTPLVSMPYVEMTGRLMKKFGLEVTLTDNHVVVPHGEYKVTEEFNVEADWSGASFFYEAVALGASDITLKGLVEPSESLQGDAVAARLFENLGVSSSFDNKGATLTRSLTLKDHIFADFRNCPDLVLPFAVACLYEGVNFRLIGVSNLRLKESDRLQSIHDEALKLGFKIETGDDFLEWKGERIENNPDATIDPHDDHRVAMSFAMVALKTGEIKISNPEVVEKSFIDFWNQLPKLGLTCREENNIMTVIKS